jgi:hypothetical protein
MKKISIGLILIAFLVAFGDEGLAQIPTNGLVGFYALDGNANDQSGNGNNGNAFNVTYSTNRFGVSASSASFSTPDQQNRPYIDIPSFASLNNFPLTLSVWFSLNAYPTAVAPLSGGSIMTLIGKEAAANRNEGALALFSEPGVTNKIAYISFSESGNFVTSFTPALNTWYNLIFTFDNANTATFYLDGSLLAQLVYTNAEFREMPFQIGSSSSQYFDPNALRPSWDGLIDDALVYDRALSSNEVSDLYNAQSVPEPSTYALLLLSGAASLWALKRRKS